MATLNCSLQQAASEFAAQARSFLSAAEGLDERELLDPARCRGWSRLDAVVHVRVGLDEMSAVAGVHSRAPIDHDAASYWRTHPDDRDADPVPHILVLRRTASAYQRPASAVRHLTEVVHRAIAVVDGMPDQPVAFQGKTLAAGDFVATWVVELAVHQLDLALHDAPPGCRLARQTLEALADARLPDALDDASAVLVGLGRDPWPAHLPRPHGFPISL
ncbi:maleylpyruvate isomerase N-terminal domain-containing protein [Arsenicicoccus piscis]|uniref:maleylpyruvate isomerase N-terminal domain-containing protein n=1 Tax=Arsenicicoccus piscis TaxID=673954 RepID=UPI001F4D0E82|nr:maleylpyruvate isomerase N-terminal domain-containing protein [Arsenicicoccus piscis]MCH8627150.1 maleylpyruvate isomerase N-terminal domain-containing protein [Arsenicicoccus piscis]